MRNVDGSVYMRSTFNIEDPADVTSLMFRMRYDDGFVAFINNVEIARANAPATLSYNSLANTGDRPDSQAVEFATFNASPFISALRHGTNVLAIHGMNGSIDSSDLLMQPELSAVVDSRGMPSNTASVTVNVQGVDFRPIARDDLYQIDEGTSLVVGGGSGGHPTPNPEQMQWPVAANGNGHFYQVVNAGRAVSWEEANLASRSAGGTLATITSAEENGFVFQLVQDLRYWATRNDDYFGPWIGAFQAPGAAEPAGGWQWVTGEPFAFVNWESGEPNNTTTLDNVFLFSLTPGVPGARWSDHPGGHGLAPTAYVIEWDTLPPERKALVSQGSTWRFRDNGIAPPRDAGGNEWKDRQYDDDTWQSGPAELGYGDGDETTLINCGPSSPACNSNNHISTWFRRHFVLEPGSASRVESLLIELLRDDGGAARPQRGRPY